MILVRSLVFNVAFYASFIGLMVIGAPCLVISRAAALRIVRAWARVSVWLLRVICGTRVEFRNLHLMPKGASILAAKHQSFLETFALILVLDDFTYILKKELLAIPFFGWYLKATEQIGIDRAKKGSTLAALQRAVRTKLAAGRQIIIFPEGTRRAVGMPPAYKVGVAALVSQSGVTCTPVALNSGLFWPRHSLLKHPGTVVIEFLPPLDPRLGKREFMQALERAIETATDALVAQAVKIDPRLAGNTRVEPTRTNEASPKRPSDPKSNNQAPRAVG